MYHKATPAIAATPAIPRPTPSPTLAPELRPVLAGVGVGVALLLVADAVSLAALALVAEVEEEAVDEVERRVGDKDAEEEVTIFLPIASIVAFETLKYPEVAMVEV